MPHLEPGQSPVVGTVEVECRESSERLNLIRALGRVEPGRAVQAVGCDWALFRIRAKRGGSLQLATATYLSAYRPYPVAQAHTVPTSVVQALAQASQAPRQPVYRWYGCCPAPTRSRWMGPSPALTLLPSLGRRSANEPSVLQTTP